MRFLLFTLFFVLWGCGKKFDTTDDAEPIYNATKSPGIFLGATSEFIELKNYAILKNSLKGVQIPDEAYKIMNSIPINFHDVNALYPNKNFVAVCRKSSKTKKSEILIDKIYWEKNPGLQYPLLLHELGHCILNRQHQTVSGGYRSLMEEVLITVYPANVKTLSQVQSEIEIIKLDSKNNSDLKELNKDETNKKCFGNELFDPRKSCDPQ